MTESNDDCDLYDTGSGLCYVIISILRVAFAMFIDTLLFPGYAAGSCMPLSGL